MRAFLYPHSGSDTGYPVCIVDSMDGAESDFFLVQNSQQFVKVTKNRGGGIRKMYKSRVCRIAKSMGKYRRNIGNSIETSNILNNAAYFWMEC